MSKDFYYATNPLRIGKHEWRYLVIDFFLGGRCTKIQFRRTEEIIGKHVQPAGAWQNSTKWPGFNINDTYLGLPKSINKLYEKNYTRIQAHLDGMTLFDRGAA